MLPRGHSRNRLRLAAECAPSAQREGGGAANEGSVAWGRHRYNTTLTIGWVDSVRYSSSSCSRLVAVMVMVMPR